MHGAFLQDLALVMIVAGLTTVLFHRLRQPVVLGYILAGLIVGPHTPWIPVHVHDEHTVEIMSELGMILLMFGLGLHFSIRKLASVGATAVIAAALEIVLMVAIGYVTGRAFGWSGMDSLFLGAILSISSTTIIVKALGELGLGKERFAELIFGILVVEDILAVAMLAILSGVATTGSLHVGEVLFTLGKLSVFLASVLVGGLLAVPPLLRYVARSRSDEVLLVASLGICFGVSLLALKLGYSVALGAFLAGAVVAEAREHGRVEALVQPVRDMFSAVFFVAIGMLIQPGLLARFAVPTAVITVAVVVGKVATCALGTFLAGNDARTSLRVGTGLAQIGEFSFIIASLGLTLHVTSDFLYPIAVTVSAVTTLLTPYLIKSSDRLTLLAVRLTPAPLAEAAQLYTAWATHVGGSGGPRGQVRRLVRRWILQCLLNMALVTAIFVVAAACARNAHGWWARLPHWTGGAESIAWLSAVTASLPLLIVTHRKLRAIALVTAEAAVTPAAAGTSTAATRAFVASAIRVTGTSAAALWLLLLTAAVMPPWPALILLVAVVAGVTALRWRSFERLYARGQATLAEVLTRPPEPPHEPAPAPTLPTVLRGAELVTLPITEGSAGRGRLIRELQLRTRTGASAVGIERDGQSLVNPGPDEELRTGDRVLLLGSRDQLDAATRLLVPALARNTPEQNGTH